MEAENYWRLMKETSDRINPLLEEAINSSECISKDSTLLELPRARIENPSKLRAHTARFVYEAIEKSEGRKPREADWIPLAAASELELISMYYLNQIWDGKGGCTTKADIDKRAVAAGITRNLAFRTLEKGYRGKIDPRKADELSALLLESDTVFLEGEYTDIFENTYSSAKAFSFEDMMNLCSKRIYQMNASFFEKIAQMAAIASDTKDEKKKEAVKKFGSNLGMLVQIVNDTADFVPEEENRGTCERYSSDSYADIKHGKLTYPIIWTLHRGTEEERNKLIEVLERGKLASSLELENLTRILVTNEAINFAISKAKEYAGQAKRELRVFSPEIRAPLSMSCSMAYTNRYYESLKKIKWQKKDLL
ncbi:hypothetical protein A3K73_04265 [Candidatus Pacearchaeota archaeon RBG_13_36_9]|nr:MAG: hypothetical protein A3K73_04265 [Candidatus Pacearchaeota archaeon RBG_13_36_9]